LKPEHKRVTAGLITQGGTNNEFEIIVTAIAFTAASDLASGMRTDGMATGRSGIDIEIS
jgi:hypothetical protein